MPVSSQIFSVDTVQIRPAAEAFLRGGLVMSAEPSTLTGEIVLPWDSYALNMALIFLSVIIFIFQLRRILRIMPYLLEGLFRSKKLIDLEDGMRLIRDRNSLVPNALLAMVLLSSAYGLYEPDFLAGFNGGVRTLVIAGVFCAFVLVRHVMIMMMSRYKLEGETYQLNNRIGNDFLILATVFSLLLAGILSVFNASPEMIRTALDYLLIFFYALFLFRRGQILSGSCSQLTAFLYLCTLEILPAGLLVASEILF